MSRRSRYTIVAAGALFLGALLGYQWRKYRDRTRFEEYKEQPSRLTAPAKQEFEERYDAYPASKRAIVLRHRDQALSRLAPDADEMEIAAAINDYVYQYLISRDNVGGAAKLLKDGHAACGGAAVCMAELLHASGVKSKYAWLLGIPGQGAHSLVEVQFKDGTRGLFDPTYGILWHNPETGKPVSMMQLLESPSLCRTTLQKSNHTKRRKAGDPVMPCEGFAASYTRRIDHKEEFYDPYMCFAERTGGCVANEGQMLFVRVSLQPDVVRGRKIWHRRYPTPWSALALLRDERGRYVSWAYELGRSRIGYDIVHVYQMSRLEPGVNYVLRLHYSESRGVTLSVQFLDSRTPTFYRKLPDHGFDPKAFKPVVVEMPFTASLAKTDVLVCASGFMILHAIELVEADRIGVPGRGKPANRAALSRRAPLPSGHPTLHPGTPSGSAWRIPGETP